MQETWVLMGRGAWQAPVHGVAKSWTRLSDNTPHVKEFLYSLHTIYIPHHLTKHLEMRVEGARETLEQSCPSSLQVARKACMWECGAGEGEDRETLPFQDITVKMHFTLLYIPRSPFFPLLISRQLGHSFYYLFWSEIDIENVSF